MQTKRLLRRPYGRGISKKRGGGPVLEWRAGLCGGYWVAIVPCPAGTAHRSLRGRCPSDGRGCLGVGLLAGVFGRREAVPVRKDGPAVSSGVDDFLCRMSFMVCIGAVGRERSLGTLGIISLCPPAVTILRLANSHTRPASPSNWIMPCRHATQLTT